MRLLRVGELGQERPAVLDNKGQIRDLSSVISDISATTLEAIAQGALNNLDLSALPAIDKEERIGACISGVGKLIGIGLNYSDHAAEAVMDIPSEPIVFMKATTAICGAGDPIEIPRLGEKTDWEVELGIVIGQRAKYVSVEEANTYIAGYCLVNDISERSFQLEHQGQWVKGKSHDSFAPIGPWLVTRDEIEDPQNLQLWTEINGERVQDGNTNKMVFNVREIVSYLSQFMTLEPGDLISTGTPPGVGMGLKPARYLKTGDQVRVGIEGLGEQSQICIPAT